VDDSTIERAEIEIDITPAMIKAGVIELASFDFRFESYEDAVERIFIAMINATNNE